MDAIASVINKALNILSTMRIADVIDILIVAYLIYEGIWLVRRTNSYNLTKGLAFLLVVWAFAEVFRLNMISSLLRKAVELGMIALVILFQPELRRLLERMGSTINTNIGPSGSTMTHAISEVAQACGDMAATKTGALIIFERNVSLSPIVGTGSVVDADTNAELLKNLFFKNAPLHDGAVIVRDGRIEAAGCVLPLSKNPNLARDLGTRHRAGLGVSEETDAVSVIVSEERGDISVAVDGKLSRHMSAGQLASVLTKELIREEKRVEKSGLWIWIKNFFSPMEDEDAADEGSGEEEHENKS
jgi:diadenylate cyclase